METIETLRFAITYIDVNIFSFSPFFCIIGEIFDSYLFSILLFYSCVIVNLPSFLSLPKSVYGTNITNIGVYIPLSEYIN